MADTKILIKPNVSRDVNGGGNSACGSLSCCSHLGKTLAPSNEVKSYVKSNPRLRNPLQGFDPGDQFTRKCIQDFTAAPLVIARTWEEPKCLFTGDRLASVCSAPLSNYPNEDTCSSTDNPQNTILSKIRCRIVCGTTYHFMRLKNMQHTTRCMVYGMCIYTYVHLLIYAHIYGKRYME